MAKPVGYTAEELRKIMGNLFIEKMRASGLGDEFVSAFFRGDDDLRPAEMAVLALFELIPDLLAQNNQKLAESLQQGK